MIVDLLRYDNFVHSPVRSGLHKSDGSSGLVNVKEPFLERHKATAATTKQTTMFKSGNEMKPSTMEYAHACVCHHRDIAYTTDIAVGDGVDHDRYCKLV